MTRFVIGQEVRLSVNYTNSSGAPTDPNLVRFKYITPAGLLVQLDYPTDPDIIRHSTGFYTVDVQALQTGSYHYRWESDDVTQFASEGNFLVTPTIFDGVGELVAETGAGLSNANTYIGMAEADQYFISRLYADAWIDADYMTRVAALVMSTRLVDDEVCFAGEKLKKSQALQLPRLGLYDRDGNALTGVPPLLQRIVCEVALTLIQKDLLKDNAIKGFRQVSIADLSFSVDPDGDAEFLPRHVLRLISELGELKSSRRRSVKTTRV